MWSYRHLTVMLGEGRQRSLSGSRQHIMLGEGRQIFSQYRVYIFYRYFLHIFVNFSANESFAHFLLTITPNARVISAIFRGEHWKNDAELLFTI